MYFNLKFVLIKLKLIALFCFASICFADAEKNVNLPLSNPELAIFPEKCVALRQGKHCYTKLKFQWHAPVRGDYCIRTVNDKKLIRCWYSSTFGELDSEFNSPEAVQYELVEISSGQISEPVEMKVNWVYTNKRKKRRWRLF